MSACEGTMSPFERIDALDMQSLNADFTLSYLLMSLSM